MRSSALARTIGPKVPEPLIMPCRHLEQPSANPARRPKMPQVPDLPLPVDRKHWGLQNFANSKFSYTVHELHEICICTYVCLAGRQPSIQKLFE